LIETKKKTKLILYFQHEHFANFKNN